MVKYVKQFQAIHNVLQHCFYTQLIKKNCPSNYIVHVIFLSLETQFHSRMPSCELSIYMCPIHLNRIFPKYQDVNLIFNHMYG